MSTPHRIVNPDTLAPPVGFSHAVVSAEGRNVYLGGQAGHLPDGSLAGPGIVEQFDRAAANVVEALTAAGGRPQDVVSMQILVTNAGEYRTELKQIGGSYQRHFGRHYPAMALLEVSGLFDPGAKIELIAIAVIPEEEKTNDR